VAHVFQTTQNLVTSHSCFAENGYEMYKIYNTRAQPLLSSLNLLFGGVLVAVVVCLSSLVTTIGRRKRVDGNELVYTELESGLHNGGVLT